MPDHRQPRSFQKPAQPANSTVSKTLIHHRVEACQRGENPTRICRVTSGWVVLGDVQFLRGYSLLLPDPVVPDLNALAYSARKTFLLEMSILGDALLKITQAERINYEILGNSEAALHAHVFPRFATESQRLRSGPAWFYDWNTAPAFDAERDATLMEDILAKLEIAGIVI